MFCDALSNEIDSPIDPVSITYTCSFGGGMGNSIGSLSTQSVEFDDETILTCEVPVISQLESADTPTSIKVDIEWSVDSSYGTVIEEDIGVVGSREVYGKTFQTFLSDSVLSHSLSILYHPSSIPTPSSCGCSPFTTQASSPATSPFSPSQSPVCDACLVCGGDDSTVDCNGDCHGSAKEDQCGDCAGGVSGVTPESGCDTGFWIEVLILSYLIHLFYTL